jgi:galactokinase
VVKRTALIDAYAARFGGRRPAVIGRAPGRVNLIGEHVDYHGGLVLPIAIEEELRVAGGPGSGRRVRVFSGAMGEWREFDPSDEGRWPDGDWGNYPKGVAVGLRRAGVPIAGADLLVDGNLKPGCGLASSAALEVATALALLGLAGADMAPVEIARLCRRAEHEFARVPCGVMDQVACACAEDGAALLVDCREMRCRPIAWPAGAEVLIVDSRSEHRLVDGPYRERLTESAAILAALRARGSALDLPREATPGQAGVGRPGLEGVAWRRVRHVISENWRVAEAASALEAGDLTGFGRLMSRSHASLRDDYEVSTPELDALVRILEGIPGVFGAKLTGAGFGGCVVAVGRTGVLDAVRAAVREGYDARYGRIADVRATRPGRQAACERLDER